MSASPDLIGKKFFSLTVLKKLSVDKHRETCWLCKCDCGNTYIAKSYGLTHGVTKCCRECTIKKIGEANVKYGKYSKSLYHAYTNMKTRCGNPNYCLYHRYGGRGIKICEEWENSFGAFLEWSLKNGYSDELTLDRINNNGDYCPENCRWTTRVKQSNNRSTNRMVTINGETDTLANWARRSGIKYGTLQRRVEKGWPSDKLLLPLMRKVKKQ